MKSVMTAIWLMVVAFGNLIDIIVISVQSEDPNAGLSQAQEFFMFAGIMAIAVVLFILMSWNYKYVEDEKKEEDDGEKKRLSGPTTSTPLEFIRKNSSSSSSDEEKETKKGEENKGFSE
jgi:type VI protein secretion system component VasK